MSIVYIRFAAQLPAAPPRAPLLERLLARAAVVTPAGDWRQAAWRVLAPAATAMPAVAAAVFQAAAPGPVADWPWACMASPVHLAAGMSSVLMPADGALALDAGEAEALAADFNRVFADAGVRLAVHRPATLLCLFDRPLDVFSHDPEAAVGHDLFAYQPSGGDAARLKALMSEIEMWLFEHAVNRARAAQARAPITALWLWGGGATSAALPAVEGWTAGDDPLFRALGRRRTAFPPAGESAGPGVVVCAAQPGAATWPAVQRDWLEPAATALRDGRLVRIDVSAGARCYSVTRAAYRRFWRRPQPWWLAFAEPSAEGIHGTG